MLSVCVPIFNYDVTLLVKELSHQINNINYPAELVFIDDGSSENIRRINENVCNKEKYIKLDKNSGRAKVRNLFLKHTRYDHLLFLDCDISIISDDFLDKYAKDISENKSDVVCGGLEYNNNPPERNKRLRWKYGIKKESKPLNIRELSPNRSFMTSNFLIRRTIFEQVKFDERLIEYGHEDTLFGYMLKKKGIKIKHINNQVLHPNIDHNKEYLEKTERGIVNLINILNYVDNDPQFIQDVSILKLYESLRNKKLTGIIYFLFICSRSILKLMLINGFVSLKLFSFYKLGILVEKKLKDVNKLIG